MEVKPRIGYEYLLVNITEDDLKEIEKNIMDILAKFGYENVKKSSVSKRMCNIHINRAYDDKDKKLGIPVKYAELTNFGKIWITYYFTRNNVVIPQRMSIEPGPGHEFSFSRGNRVFKAMKSIEKELSKYRGRYEMIYKCLGYVKGFDIHVKQF